LDWAALQKKAPPVASTWPSVADGTTPGEEGGGKPNLFACGGVENVPAQNSPKTCTVKVLHTSGSHC